MSVTKGMQEGSRWACYQGDAEGGKGESVSKGMQGEGVEVRQIDQIWRWWQEGGGRRGVAGGGCYLCILLGFRT